MAFHIAPHEAAVNAVLVDPPGAARDVEVKLLLVHPNGVGIDVPHRLSTQPRERAFQAAFVIRLYIGDSVLKLLSRRKTSMANSTPAMGARKIAAIPAAAPQPISTGI